jgi:PAS domain-containing protein
MPTKDKKKRHEQYVAYSSKPGVKEKRNAKTAEWAANNKDRIQANGQRRRAEKRAACMIATIKNRAVKRNLEFDLDKHINEIQDRINKGFCELTGYPFTKELGRLFDTPSIDRIDPAKGYVYDNIRIVLNLINASLGDWGEEKVKDVMRHWLCKK